MLRRVLLYLVLVAAVAGVFFGFRRGPARRAETAVASGPATLAQMIDARAKDSWRLPPDARFLEAVGDVEQVLTGRPSPRATATWNGAGWTIASGQREVGRLGEYPRFGAMRGLLRDWAIALGVRDSIAPAAAASRAAAGIEGQLAALHALRAADLADRAWAAGRRDAAMAELGTRALVWMAAESFDEAGAGEAIPARALAWTGIATALDSTAVLRESALLAEVMGYPFDACELAAGLGPSDPIYLYVFRRDEILDAMASRGGSGREPRWLSLRRCVQRGDLEAWTVAAERGFDADTMMSLPVLTSGLALGRFESAFDAGARLLGAVMADLRLNAVSPAPEVAIGHGDLGQAMETFETLLASASEPAAGAFLDRDLVAAWYRGAFYSSWMRIGDHVRTRISDVESTEDLARALGDGGSGPEPAAEFRRWFAHLAAREVTPALREQLQADLAGLPHFGPAPRLATWAVVAEVTNAEDPWLRRCARELQSKLDSRPATLAAWSNLVGGALLDLAAAEPMWQEAARASHSRDLARRGWWAAYRGDRPAVDRMLADSRYPAAEKCRFVSALRPMMPGDSLRFDAVCEQLVADHPDDWPIAREWVRDLAKRHRNDRIRAVTRAWLAREGRDRRPYDDVEVRNAYARACLEDGRYEDGYAAIASVIRSWEETAMSLGAELLDRRASYAEAETLAQATWNRYPNSERAQALAVALWWRHGKFDLAARALAEAKHPLGGAGWRETLGERFVALERERPRDARRAVTALAARKLDDWPHLGSLVAALAAAGRHEAAAEFAGRIRTGGVNDRMGTLVAYQNVKAARGEKAAADWILAHLPDREPRTLGWLHVAALGMDAPELTWVLPIPEAKREVADIMWLARVVAMLRDAKGTPEQAAELRTWFASPGPGNHRAWARMLLGALPADSVLAMPLDARAESEACFYLGLQRQSEGDATHAAQWYAQALDANVRGSAEHHWASTQMSAWRDQGRSLDRIATDLRRRAAPAQSPAAALVLP